MPDALDLFCGAGGTSTGCELAGIHVKHAVDKWAGCKETYERNHPGAKFTCASILDLDPRDFTDVDVVVGSPPCQEFSQANKNRDPEAGMELVRAFREWIDVIRPRWWVMENVRRVVEHVDKKDYPVIEILNAADFGVPQKRFRCFAGKYVVPRPTHARKAFTTIEGNRIKQWVTTRQALAGIVDFDGGAMLTTEYGNAPECNSPYFSAGEPARTVTSVPFRIVPAGLMFNKRTMDKARFEEKLASSVERPVTLPVAAMARIQGFPVGFEFFGSTDDRYTMVGNAVPPLMARRVVEGFAR